MPDIALDFDELREVNGSIKQILVDFDGLPDESREAADAIGTPFDDDRLQHEVATFASQWEERRDMLGLDLFGVHEFIVRILDGFGEIDEQASAAFQLDTGEANAM